MNINNFFDKILIINYDKVRKDYMIQHLAEKNITNYEFIKGFDGAKLKNKLNKLVKIHPATKLDPPIYHAWPLSLGEIGCTLSHLKAYKTIVKKNYHKVLICEDDIRFNEHYDNHEEWFNELPEYWDILHFHSWRTISDNIKDYSYPIEYKLSKERNKISERVYTGYKEYGGTNCYAITHSAARTLLTTGWPVQYAADGMTQKLSDNKIMSQIWGCYVIFPFICEPISIENKSSLIDEVDNCLKGVIQTRRERYKKYK